MCFQWFEKGEAMSNVSSNTVRISPNDGDPVRDWLASETYRGLRAVARDLIRSQGKRLQATSIVDAAILRVMKSAEKFEDGAHWFAVVCRNCRYELLDRARSEQAIKNGGGGGSGRAPRFSLNHDDEIAATQAQTVDLESLDAALNELQRLREPQWRVVTLRLHGGLQMQQIALVTKQSLATVEREWRHAQALLRARFFK